MEETRTSYRTLAGKKFLQTHHLCGTWRNGRIALGRYEVLTAVRISMLVFWVITPCALVARYQHFGETCCLHLQG
jgi:hypothetical protein